MFLDFFLLLKNDGIPVSPKEYLMLLEALDKGIAEYNVEEFYFLSRSALIKNEIHLDRFDQLFGLFFKGIETIPTHEFMKIPEEWLRKQSELMITDEMREQIKAMGGLDKLIDRLKELMKEQKENERDLESGIFIILFFVSKERVFSFL